MVDWADRRLRSLLLVSGAAERELDVACASESDAVVMDLEDSLPPDQKVAARHTVSAAIGRCTSTITVIARVNGISTPWFEDDVAAVVGPRLDAIIVPKVEEFDTLARADASIAAAEEAAEMERGHVRVLALVETALGLTRCEHILANAPTRVHTAIFGTKDFTSSIGVGLTRNASELAYGRSRLVVASRAAGLAAPIDGTWGRLADGEGLELDSRRSRELGFQGRVTTHAPQVRPIMRHYSATIANGAASAPPIAPEPRSVQLHVGFQGDRPIAETARLAVVAEKLGYDGVWLADSQNLFRDVYCALTVVAERTTAIRIGTGVTNPVTRHPVVAAGAIGSLRELAGDRLFLGIGTGETAVQSVGRQSASLKTMEAAITVTRAMLAGEEVTHEGTAMRMPWTDAALGEVPIVMASTGPRSLELAGRIADGVYLKIGVHPDLLAYAREHVTIGARSADRSLDDFHTYAMVPVAVDDDPAVARRAVAGFSVAIARAVMAGVPAERVPPEISNAMTELDELSAGARARQGYLKWLSDPDYLDAIPGSIIESFAISGPADIVRERIEALSGLGVDGVVAPLVNADPWPQLLAIGERVLPNLSRAS